MVTLRPGPWIVDRPVRVRMGKNISRLEEPDGIYLNYML